MINGVLVKIGLTAGPIGPGINPVIIFFVSKCVTGIDVLGA